MTPISAMTNEELDRLIAERRGWKYYPNGKWKWVLYYADEECEGEYQYTCPAFTADPRYAFELLEEIPMGCVTINSLMGLFGNKNVWEIVMGFDDGEEDIVIHCDTICRAIAEAWAEWKGGE